MGAHKMLPTTLHDELAQQSFVLSLKQHISANITPGNHKIYDGRVLPELRRKNGCVPNDRHEVRRAMEHDPYHQMWGSLMRLAQELMWDYVGECVDRQLDDLVERSKDEVQPLGSLRLDKKLEQPRYLALVDQHAQPGSYYTETRPDDVRAGAVLDQGANLYHFGKNGGSIMDGRGRTLVAHLFERFPDFRPRRILDLGCSVGASTLPFVEFYPGADVYAIDTAAPLLRYAHGRAEGLGRAVHFAQQDAEALDYPDESFDLVVSLVLLHETSTHALPKIFHECQRVLKPGGVVAHLEVPVRYKDMESLCEQVLRDWQTYYNDEPFWGKVCETDLVAVLEKLGFRDVEAGYQKVTTNPRCRRSSTFSKVPDSRPGNWYIVSGVRS
ncbi:MAG: class I SAM-dependent methyltransferase [Nitrospinota bacterium]